MELIEIENAVIRARICVQVVRASVQGVSQYVLALLIDNIGNLVEPARLEIAHDFGQHLLTLTHADAVDRVLADNLLPCDGRMDPTCDNESFRIKHLDPFCEAIIGGALATRERQGDDPIGGILAENRRQGFL